MAMFPVVDVDKEARCFECKAPLGGHKDSGYPPGRGQRIGWCPDCKKSTFYDLAHELRKGKDKEES